jgi:hypothetical protein
MDDASREPRDPAVEAAEADATGVGTVDAALARLRDLADAPVEDHVEIFDDVQRQLHEALAELEVDE